MQLKKDIVLVIKSLDSFVESGVEIYRLINDFPKPNNKKISAFNYNSLSDVDTFEYDPNDDIEPIYENLDKEMEEAAHRDRLQLSEEFKEKVEEYINWEAAVFEAIQESFSDYITKSTFGIDLFNIISSVEDHILSGERSLSGAIRQEVTQRLNKQIETLRDISHKLEDVRYYSDPSNEPQPQTAYEALDEHLQTSSDKDIHNLLRYFSGETYHDLKFNFKEGEYYQIKNGRKNSFSIVRNGKKTLLYPFKILLSQKGEWLVFDDFKEAELYSIKNIDELVIELRKNTSQKLKTSDHINQSSDWLMYDKANERIRLIPDK